MLTLPMAASQTLEGTAACFLAGAIGATAYTTVYGRLGLYDRPVGAVRLATGCVLSSLAGAAVESLPLEGDNLTVALAAVVTAVWFFGF